MNPIRRIYTFFHKNLLTKTMAIGVVLALMGTTCLIQLANIQPVIYTHLRAHETDSDLVCRLLLEKK